MGCKIPQADMCDKRYECVVQCAYSSLASLGCSLEPSTGAKATRGTALGYQLCLPCDYLSGMAKTFMIAEGCGLLRGRCTGCFITVHVTLSYPTIQVRELQLLQPWCKWKKQSSDVCVPTGPPLSPSRGSLAPCSPPASSWVSSKRPNVLAQHWSRSPNTASFSESAKIGFFLTSAS